MDDAYWSLRDRLCAVELHLLRVLAFNVAAPLPFAYLLHLCRLVFYKRAQTAASLHTAHKGLHISADRLRVPIGCSDRMDIS